MRKFWVYFLAALSAAFFMATPASAQATRTWISGVGDDANPCSRTAPCRTWAGALPKTAEGGEINVLDGGGFGAVTITKSITLRGDPGGGNAGVLVAGQNGIIINADATDKVVLEGLDIEGLGMSTTSPGIRGVWIIQARDVLISNCSIRYFTDPTDGAGVSVDASTKASVVVQNSTLWGNRYGVRVQSAGGNGTARVYNSSIGSNTLAGVSVTGAGNVIEIEGNTIIRSPKSIDISSGGSVVSYGDNVVAPGGDAPTSTLPKI